MRFRCNGHTIDQENRRCELFECQLEYTDERDRKRKALSLEYLYGDPGGR
jgi:hypothetical protein